MNDEARSPGLETCASPPTDDALLGIPFARLSAEACAAHIAACAEQGAGGWLVTPNASIVRRYEQDDSFRELVARATLFAADGAPIIWVYEVLGRPLPGRVTGADLVELVSSLAASKGLRACLVGWNQEVAERTGLVLSRKYPGFAIADTICSPNGFSGPDDMEMLASRVLEARPEIVFVGLGCPLQEQVIDRVRSSASGAWWLGIGGSFDVLVGDVQRAPLWAQRAGLEWLFRVAAEPGRLWRRYLLHDAPFVLVLLARASIARLTGRRTVKLRQS